MIKGIKFASIPVADQDRALEFYTQKLGFRVLTDQPFNDEQRWIELSIPGAETSVVLFTADEHKDRIGTFGNLSFWSADVGRTYQELKAKGVEFSKPPTEEFWGWNALFKDDSGNWFSLGQKK